MERMKASDFPQELLKPVLTNTCTGGIDRRAFLEGAPKNLAVGGRGPRTGALRDAPAELCLGGFKFPTDDSRIKAE